MSFLFFQQGSVHDWRKNPRHPGNYTNIMQRIPPAVLLCVIFVNHKKEYVLVCVMVSFLRTPCFSRLGNEKAARIVSNRKYLNPLRSWTFARSGRGFLLPNDCFLKGFRA